MADPIIRVEHLEKRFGNTEVLKDISFEVFQGDVVSIIGVSGTGKSTMLRCINLLSSHPEARSSSTERISSPRIMIWHITEQAWAWSSNSSTFSTTFLSLRIA